MDKIFTALRNWFRSLLEIDCPPDALSRLDANQLADLPPLHPVQDEGCAG